MTNKPEPPEEIHMWFADNGNVRKWSFEKFAEAEVKYIREDSGNIHTNTIEKYLTEVYGARCEEFQPGCMTCSAWASYDDYKSEKARIELTRQAQDMGMYDEPKLSLEELKKETSQEP
jgi:hypothetical protein